MSGAAKSDRIAPGDLSSVSRLSTNYHKYCSGMACALAATQESNATVAKDRAPPKARLRPLRDAPTALTYAPKSATGTGPYRKREALLQTFSQSLQMSVSAGRSSVRNELVITFRMRVGLVALIQSSL